MAVLKAFYYVSQAIEDYYNGRNYRSQNYGYLDYVVKPWQDTLVLAYPYNPASNPYDKYCRHYEAL